MNFLEVPQIDNIRMTQTTQITHHEEFSMAESRSNNILASSNTSNFQSKISRQQHSVKPTKSKIIINSYLNNMNKEKKVTFQKPKEPEESRQKSLTKNTIQKLTLISNAKEKQKEICDKNKQNRPSRANSKSKQKLHLTTLHSSIPVSHQNSKLEYTGKQNIVSQRDMFLNISITNQSDVTPREDFSMKNRIHNLENEISMLYTNLSLTKLSLQDKQNIIIRQQNQIKELIKSLKDRDQQIVQFQSTINDKIQFQSRTVQQKYEIAICERNQKINEVVLQYQNQISELKQQVNEANKFCSEMKRTIQNHRLHQNLDNINTNKIIKQLQTDKRKLVSQITRLNQQHQQEIRQLTKEMSQEITRFKQQSKHLQNKLLDQDKMQSEILTELQSCYKNKQIELREKLGQQKIMKSTIDQKQKQIQQLNSIIKSLTKQKQLLSQSIQFLTKRGDSTMMQLQISVDENQKLVLQLQSVSKQAEILKKLITKTKEENDLFKTQAANSLRSIQETSKIRQQYLVKSKQYQQIQSKMMLILKENQQLKTEISFLAEQRITQQRLIFKMQDSIENQLEEQRLKYTKQYQQLQQKHITICQQLEKYKSKRKMQKAIIQESNHFYQEIYSKCQQIYNKPI